eukprot:XP_001695942.1 predicted protein [Chlamydomonas reinhardtii]
MADRQYMVDRARSPLVPGSHNMAVGGWSTFDQPILPAPPPYCPLIAHIARCTPNCPLPTYIAR